MTNQTQTKVENISAKNFEEKVLKSKLPVLVDFWATWCMPCKMMAPVLDELSIKLDGKLNIAKVDTEDQENLPLAYEYQIQSIPNMKLFYQGKVIHEFVGFRAIEVFEEELNSVLENLKTSS